MKIERMQQIGRYLVTGELGRGAMGVVYKAEDPAIGRTVAIKTIRFGDGGDLKEREFLRQRLVREARSAGILSHPGIVTIYDVMEQDGIGYVFMEFVDGPTLNAEIHRGPASPELIVSVIEQTAAALDYAHSQGIVHRDIKPANLMLAQGTRVKIADFGLAKFSSQQASMSLVVLGTPAYMSPEQINGPTIDGRSDQYALAVIAYQLLTGEKPFAADSVPSLLFKIVNEEALPATRLNSTLGAAMDQVLKKALSKKAEQRYPTCSEFARAFRGSCESRPNWQPMRQGSLDSQETVAEPMASPVLPVVASPPPAVPPATPPRPAARTRSNLPAFAAGVVTIGLMFFASSRLLFNNDPTNRPSPQSSQPQRQGSDDGKPSAIGPPAAKPEPPPPPPQSTGEKPPESPPVEEPKPRGRQTAEAKTVPIERPDTPDTRDYPFHIATSPPGARILFDGNPATSCTSPCDRILRAGRHTLAVTLEGHRLQSRIFNLPQDRDLLITLDRALGTLTVRSTPSGATINLNGQERRERTPASFTLPTGRYKLEIAKDGFRKETHEIEVKDGVVSNVDVAWPQAK